jgi:hypothetical protein
MREDTSPNYIVATIESQLKRVRTELRWKRDALVDSQHEVTQLGDQITDLEAEEKQLASFLDFRVKGEG